MIKNEPRNCIWKMVNTLYNISLFVNASTLKFIIQNVYHNFPKENNIGLMYKS